MMFYSESLCHFPGNKYAVGFMFLEKYKKNCEIKASRHCYASFILNILHKKEESRNKKCVKKATILQDCAKQLPKPFNEQ